MNTHVTPLHASSSLTRGALSAAALLVALAASAAVLLVALAAPAAAEPQWQTWSNTSVRDAVSGQIVDVQIMVGGRTMPLYSRPQLGNRWYVQATEGRNYAVALRNLTGQRIAVLIAVDGLNVVNGQRSILGNREAMYVLGPWESATIRGWRTSLDEVRRFVFVDEERSYAERTGQSNADMGWIRVAAFREQRLQAWNDVRGMYRDKAGNEAPQAGGRQAAPESRAQGDVAPSPSADNFPGTGWGSRQNDPVQLTTFTAEPYATDQLTLRYEYASGLRALGIVPWRYRQDRLSQRELGTVGFAQPPRW